VHAAGVETCDRRRSHRHEEC